MTSTARMSRDPSSVEGARDGIRSMILRRRLMPGEQIRQQELAEEFGISRSPIREALQSLHAEGLVTHEPHRGYFVTRLDAGELAQVYAMRAVLESLALSGVEVPVDPEVVRDLQRVNSQIASSSPAPDGKQVDDLAALNRDFHFAIFGLSGLDLVVQEISRLWMLSEPYRALYLWDRSTRVRIAAEHEEMIRALTGDDPGQLTETMRRHRESARDSLVGLLGERSPQRHA